MKNIAIFASGSGTNAQKIIEYFRNSNSINVALILSNNPKAYVIQRAISFNIPCGVFNRDDFYKSDKVIKKLNYYNVDFIVLAGFLWLVPDNILTTYQNNIINIHPALLPKYGGKGMYGDIVHQAVVENKESETGITIHYVNKNYDEGKIIFQEKCIVDLLDNAETVANKVHELEHRYYPMIIEKIILEK